MDNNKLKVLQDINYEIQKVCGNCKHSGIYGAAQYGTCKKKTYEHLKHIGPPRQLSIHVFGSCNSHEYMEGYAAVLTTWAEFLK